MSMQDLRSGPSLLSPEERAPEATRRTTARQVRTRRLTGFQVLATGSYAPETIVTNEELHTLHGFDPDWLRERTGIRERRHAPPEMATSDLCHAACVRCLQKAEVDPDDIDLLIVATTTPDMPTPPTACLLQDRLGLSCGAFDIQAACTGFMYALATGAQFVASGNAHLCLVVGGDTGSRLGNPEDRNTYPLLGDAAGAVLLGPGGRDQGFLAYQLGSDGSGAELLRRPAGGSRMPLSEEAIRANLHYLHMEGRAVFRWAVQTIQDSAAEVLQAADIEPCAIDLFVPHQANLRIFRSAAERLGVPPHKVYHNIERYGNTVAASIPLALDEALSKGRVGRGDRVLLCGFGGGLTWGSAVVGW